MLRSEFVPQVFKIVWRQGLVEEFLDERQKVMQGANGTEWGIGWMAQQTAGGGQQEGGFDERKRELSLVELRGKVTVVARVTIRRIR